MTVNNTDKTFPTGEDHVEFSSIANKIHGDLDAVRPKGDYSGAVQKTDPVDIRLVRKLDMRIMVGTRFAISTPSYTLTQMQPILWAMYFLNYLDRNALPQARLNNLEEDLDLKGVEYNTAISILFVGYILMQGESNTTSPDAQRS